MDDWNPEALADKGFYSEKNIEGLIKEKLRFVIPLKRNSSLINYQKIESSDKKTLDGFFKFQGRIIGIILIQLIS